MVVSTTHCIPALAAASTPLGASSNTIQSAGKTFNHSAHVQNVSALGLLFTTSSALTSALK